MKDPLKSSFDLLCIGQATIDITMSVEQHPLANEKISAQKAIICGGGPAANAALTAQKLNCSSAFLGSLGNDSNGQIHRKELTENGVVTEYIIQKNHPTSFSTILVKPNGERSVVNYKQDTPHLNLNEIIIPTEPFKIALFDGHEPNLTSLNQIFQKRQINTILDAGSLHKGTQELAQEVDFLIASEKFAIQYCSECLNIKSKDLFQALKSISHINPNTIITCGENGLLWSHNNRFFKMGAFTIKAKDTTGAGDVFHGAFAAGLIKGLTFQKNCINASATAALSCMKEGARTSIPNQKEVDLFIQENTQPFIQEFQ